MEGTDLQRIRHILLHCEDIETSLRRHHRSYEELLGDHEFYNSICMDVMQIGELSNSLTTAFRNDSSAQIPWASIRSVRNIVAHAYETVDSARLWDIATHDIPALRAFCQQTLAEADHT